MTSLGELLRAQLELQVDSFDTDPRKLTGDARANFVTWNVIALEDELHEAMQEIKWKPWLTTGRGWWVDPEAYVQELVDAFHFFMNLLLLVGGDPDDLADEFVARYFAKREVNAKRQADGYDGTKDSDGRADDEPELPFDPGEAGRRDVVERHLAAQAANERKEQGDDT